MVWVLKFVSIVKTFFFVRRPELDECCKYFVDLAGFPLVCLELPRSATIN